MSIWQIAICLTTSGPFENEIDFKRRGTMSEENTDYEGMSAFIVVSSILLLALVATTAVAVFVFAFVVG
jgi:hypothetical protein